MSRSENITSDSITAATSRSAFGVNDGFIGSTVDGKKGDINSDLYLEDGGVGTAFAEDTKVPLMRRRIFRNGCLLFPFIFGITILTLLIIICIFFPTTYMGIGPIIAKKAVDHTNLYPTNIRVTKWSYEPANDTDNCAQYFPQSLTIIQDILFSDIPWYAQMGSSYLEPANMDMLYNGTKFAELILPKIDLSHPTNNQKWSNNTECTMIVTNTTAFLEANANILPLGSLVIGWAIWQQVGNVILQTELLGITSYYSADMNKYVNVSNVQFLTGPMADIDNNVFDALLCTGDLLS